jgi:serine/threonine protein kinase
MILGMKLPAGILVDNKFEILEPKGRGANGATFVAKQVGLDRLVVLKTVFQTDSTDRQRFLREAYALSLISHPNVVAFYGYGTWQDEPYFAMELVHGSNLEQVLTQPQTLPLQSLVCIMRQIAAGLSCLHKNDVVHRDLTPLNIIVADAETPDPSVKIIDLGLAKLLGEHNHRSANPLTEAGQALGSVMYMSPEQCRGEAAQTKSDIYALGCIMYRMLAGAPPYAGESAITLMLQHTESEFPDLSLTGDSRIAPTLKKLNSLIRACTAREPSDRPDIEELIGQLGATAELIQRSNITGERISSQSQPTAPPNVVPMLARKPAWTKFLLLGAASILLALFAISVMRSASQTTTADLNRASDPLKETASLAHLERAGHDLEAAGNWEAMKPLLWRACNGIPFEWKALTPGLAEQAESYYTHSAVREPDGFRLALCTNMATYADDHHDAESAKRWLARALDLPLELKRRSNLIYVSGLLQIAGNLTGPDEVTTLGQYYFSSLKAFTGAGGTRLPLSSYITSMRQPLDAVFAAFENYAPSRKLLPIEIDSCLRGFRSKAKDAADVCVLEQYQGELSQSLHDYPSACKHLKQALSVENDALRKQAEAARIRVELALNLSRCGKRDEGRVIALDAIRISEHIEDRRAPLVARRVYASLLVDEDATSGGAYDASKRAFLAAADWQSELCASHGSFAQRMAALTFVEQAAGIYQKVLVAQHKTGEANALKQRLRKIYAST